jgi:Domain of unknown function (DUF4112)
MTAVSEERRMSASSKDDGSPPSRSYGATERSPAQEMDWEVLPPEQRQERTALEPLFKWLALIMDDLLRLPGTRFRFGLDPIIGLLPGIGDASSAIISVLALIYAVRSGLPKILLARMAANILINELVGIVPGVGDAFSFWFKSNARNYQLLRRHLGMPQRSRKGDWIFVIVVLGLLFVIIFAGLLVSFLVLQWLVHLFTGSPSMIRICL